MSNTYAANVRRIDTTATITGPVAIKAIKYIGASSGTASVRAGASSSGSLVWEQSGTANWDDHDMNIIDAAGIYVKVTNSAVIYLYQK